MPHDFKFPKAARLRKEREFEDVFKGGVCLRSFPLIVRALARPEQKGARLGLAITRRVGKACRRNRIKRLIREAFRLNRPMLRRPHDLVISLMKTSRPFGTAQIHGALRTVFEQLNQTPDPARDTEA